MKTNKEIIIAGILLGLLCLILIYLTLYKPTDKPLIISNDSINTNILIDGIRLQKINAKLDTIIFLQEVNLNYIDHIHYDLDTLIKRLK